MQETEEEEERSESCEMEHSYDDTVNNILIVSQDESTLEASLGGSQAAGGSCPAGSSPVAATASPPLFNIIPLLPNSYLESAGYASQSSTNSDQHRISGDYRWQRNRPRDTSSYLRSRLERSNAIRRNSPSSDQTNFMQQLGGLRHLDNPYSLTSPLPHSSSDSNQRSTTETRSDLVYRFDNLLRELTLNRSSSLSGGPSITEALTQSSHSVDSNPRSARSVFESGLRGVSLQSTLPATEVSVGCDAPCSRNLGSSRWEMSFPHAGDVESALRERESFNRFVSRGNVTAGRDLSENRLGLTPNSSGDSIAQVFANGYVPSDDEPENERDSDHEGHSDSENFYDDNFEDYDEHYIISGEGNVVADDFVQGEEEGVEQEILELGSGEELDNRFVIVESSDSRFIHSIIQDNRFASDDEEADGSGEAGVRNEHHEGSDGNEEETNNESRRGHRS